VVGLQFGFGHPFQRCYSHGALFRRITLAVHSRCECYQNKSGTQPKIHWLAGSLL
jgi:hypothetical protein